MVSAACPRSKGTCLLQAGKPVKKRFKKYPIGYVHIDIAAVQTEQGKLQLFVAIDRTCKLAYAERHTDKKKT